jgi:tetratricopeptide (TPR) repeat protein
MTNRVSISLFSRSNGHVAILLAGLAISVFTVFAYRNSFSGELILDDEMSVAENPSIRHLSDIRSVLSPPPTSTVGGRPVANLSFAINYAVGGTQVRGYHAVNFAVHLAASLVLFGIVCRTLRRSLRPALLSDHVHAPLLIALTVAVVWAVHPLLTDTVTYVSQRTEELMGLFYLFTLYAFIRGVDTASRGWLAISVVACGAGMGCKEVMVTAPLIVILYDRTFVGGTFREAWKQRWRYYCRLAATWVLLAALMSSGLGKRGAGFGLGVTWWQYALTESQAVLLYLRLAVWPHPLVFDYGPAFVSSITEAVPYLLLLVVLVGTVGVLLWWRPVPGFLAAGFFIILAPTSSVVPVATQPIAESRMYLPLAFLVALGTAGLYTVLKRRALLLAALIVVAFVSLTNRRNELFGDAAALWRDTLAKRPENSRAHSNYGAVLFARGNTDDAIAHERRALTLEPTIARARCNLAAALIKKGQFEAALQQGRLALQLLPEITEANYQVGNALVHLGRPAEAVPYYEAEIRRRPDFADAYSNLGGALYMLGRPADALPHFEAALKLRPDFADARDNLANALGMIGRTNEAIAVYRESLRLRPEALSVRCNLAIVLARSGRFDEADAEFRAALKIQPNYQPARDGLAQLQAARAQQMPATKR